MSSLAQGFTFSLFHLAFALPLLFVLVKALSRSRHTSAQLDHIPTVGPSGPISSYLGALQYFWDARAVVQQGYRQYYGHAFKIPLFTQWLVVVSGPEMIEDMRRSTLDQLSFRHEVMEQLEVQHTMGWEKHFSDYQIDLVRVVLTRNINDIFPALQDEIVTAFSDEIPIQQEWVKIRVLETIMRVVSRTINRAFIGLPLCRDPDYKQLNIDFTVAVFTSAIVIGRFPEFLKPVVARYLTNAPGKLRQGIAHLGPLIQTRLDQEEEHGSDWPGKPNDMISWLLDHAPEGEKTVRHITLRLLLINIAAIHTTSMSFTNALYKLAAAPDLVQMLRDEVEPILIQEGWTKSSMSKMRKLDSFLKEILRLYLTNAVNLDRKVLKDFTFSNGITLPAGTHLAIAAYATHLDENNYPSPEEFQALRYYELGNDGPKQQMATPNLQYHAFGNGRNVCSGRIFASNSLKAMICHVITTYDVKFSRPDAGEIKPKWLAAQTFPDPSGEVLFRARQKV
ncbi:cytochrome P450 [Mycena floridula]|nr:cytochrome P450 [Mycena floridula]